MRLTGFIRSAILAIFLLALTVNSAFAAEAPKQITYWGIYTGDTGGQIEHAGGWIDGKQAKQAK